MLLPERRFTAYSGTVLENFRDCSYLEEDQVFFRKTDDRFRSPLGVYYTPKISEACYYSVSQVHEIINIQWRQIKPAPFLSDFLRSMPHHTPLIMCGELYIWRRFPVINPGFINRFPVNLVFVLKEDIDIIDSGILPLDPNLPDLFQPANPIELLSKFR